MELSVSTTRGQHLIGKEVGDCLLEKLIGYGGTSAVFLAQPRNSEQKVAVKVFLPRSTMDTQAQKSFYRRFLREAKAASELDHPHILSVYSYGEHQGLPYIIMPYLPGGTLAEYVKRHGPLSLRMAQSYLQQIGDALDYAHECGCVHCDVKPANILLDSDGQVLLSDFGIVRLLEGTSLSAQQSVKSPETLMGTPDYISPEQALGEDLDGRSDIYSLGVTLFYLLAGNPPFKSDSTIAMALMHVHEKPPLLGSQRADVTPQIDGVISKAMAKWPEDRYQSGSAFSAAFSEAVAQVSNIDRVALVNRASVKKSSDEYAFFESEVKVRLRPLSVARMLRSPGPLRSRTTLLLLGLCILLILAITSAFVLNVANSPRTRTITPPLVPSDALAGNESAWPSSPTFYFSQGSYHIVNKSGTVVAIALYGTYQYGNFHLSVTTNEITGTRNAGDYYGVVFRSAEDQSRYYVFEIYPSGGQFAFSRYDGIWHYLKNGTIASLKADAGQTNTITVDARGNTFTFGVNGIPITTTFTDTVASPFATGEVGLLVEGDNTEVAFSHMLISKLP